MLIGGSKMKWKVRVVQYSEPVIVEAETMQEAQEFGTNTQQVSWIIARFLGLADSLDDIRNRSK